MYGTNSPGMADARTLLWACDRALGLGALATLPDAVALVALPVDGLVLGMMMGWLGLVGLVDGEEGCFTFGSL